MNSLSFEELQYIESTTTNDYVRRSAREAILNSQTFNEALEFSQKSR